MVEAVAALRLDLIGRYLRPHRRTVLLGAIALVIVNLLGVTIPMEVSKAVDELQEGFAYQSVLIQAGWIVLLASLMGVVPGVPATGVRCWTPSGSGYASACLIACFGRNQPGFGTGSGEVIARATSDVENIRRLLGFSILSLTNTILVYSLTLPAMLAIDPGLTVAAVGLYPVMLGCVRLFGSRMMKQQRRQQENLADLSELIQEDLSGIGAIKIYGQEASELEAFSERNHNYRDSQIRLARTRSTLFPLLEGISSFSLLLLLSLGSGKLEQGSLSTGDLVALILYVGQLVFPTALLGFTLNTFQIGQVSLERVEELLQRVPLIRDQRPRRRLRQLWHSSTRSFGTRGHIRYEDAAQDTLHGVDSIEAGELVAVVGRWAAEKQPGACLWAHGSRRTRTALHRRHRHHQPAVANPAAGDGHRSSGRFPVHEQPGGQPSLRRSRGQ